MPGEETKPDNCDEAGAAAAKPLVVEGAMLSHPGRMRELNEDVVLYRVPGAVDPLVHLGTLAVVADGMGGHAAGEIASQIAAWTIHLLYYQENRPVPEALARAFGAANTVIHDRSRAYPECAGMGTTCTALVIRDGHAWLGHIGDSRAYMVRQGAIHQLSKDDSLVAQLVDEGTLTPEQARISPDRNVLLRALGTRPSVDPCIWDEGMKLAPGDALVLCSDGLCDLVEGEQIIATVMRYSPFEACQALIRAALDAGGHDNISVGVFAVSSDPLAAATERPTRDLDLSACSGPVG
jgi:PPM family protein phosphatase